MKKPIDIESRLQQSLLEEALYGGVPRPLRGSALPSDTELALREDTLLNDNKRPLRGSALPSDTELALREDTLLNDNKRPLRPLRGSALPSDTELALREDTLLNDNKCALREDTLPSYNELAYCKHRGEHDAPLDDELAPLIGAMFRAIADMGERPVVVVCFGTTSISGDSLGPQVGSLLRDRYNVPAFVYGTEEHSVNGKNMTEWLSFIRSVHENALFIAVDASLGGRDKVGQILLRNDGVCPAAIKGKRTRFGDVGILAVVAESGDDPLMRLMSVSYDYISVLAYKIAFMIKNALPSE